MARDDDRALLADFCAHVSVRYNALSFGALKVQELIDAFLASRQPQGELDMSPPTSDYLDNPTDCSMPVGPPAAPEPERFWRVCGTQDDNHFHRYRAYSCHADLDQPWCGPPRVTYDEARADGIASGLPEWKGESK